MVDGRPAPRLDRRRLVSALLALAAIPACSRAARATDLVTAPQPIPAPRLVLPGLDGRPVDLAALRGRPVLVSFWALWCPPCRQELPGLLELSRWPSIAVLAVNLGDPAERVKAFVADAGLGGLPILLDSQTASTADWHVGGLPTAYGLDRQGVIRFAAVGPLDGVDAVAARLRDL